MVGGALLLVPLCRLGSDGGRTPASEAWGHGAGLGAVPVSMDGGAGSPAGKFEWKGPCPEQFLCLGQGGWQTQHAMSQCGGGYTVLRRQIARWCSRGGRSQAGGLLRHYDLEIAVRHGLELVSVCAGLVWSACRHAGICKYMHCKEPWGVVPGAEFLHDVLGTGAYIPSGVVATLRGRPACPPLCY